MLKHIDIIAFVTLIVAVITLVISIIFSVKNDRVAQHSLQVSEQGLSIAFAQQQDHSAIDRLSTIAVSTAALADKQDKTILKLVSLAEVQKEANEKLTAQLLQQVLQTENLADQLAILKDQQGRAERFDFEEANNLRLQIPSIVALHVQDSNDRDGVFEIVKKCQEFVQSALKNRVFYSDQGTSTVLRDYYSNISDALNAYYAEDFPKFDLLAKKYPGELGGLTYWLVGNTGPAGRLLK